jgi:hypothetical protein
MSSTYCDTSYSRSQGRVGRAKALSKLSKQLSSCRPGWEAPEGNRPICNMRLAIAIGISDNTHDANSCMCAGLQRCNAAYLPYQNRKPAAMVKLSLALLGVASLLASVHGQQVSIGSLSGGLPPGSGPSPPPRPAPVRSLPARATLIIGATAWLHAVPSCKSCLDCGAVPS